MEDGCWLLMAETPDGRAPRLLRDRPILRSKATALTGAPAVGIGWPLPSSAP